MLIGVDIDVDRCWSILFDVWMKIMLISSSFLTQAKISVLFHATAIYEGFQTTVHIGSIRQTAVIVGIMGGGRIGTNDSAAVLFRFQCHPEYVAPGMRILFREGTCKGIGKVTQVFPLNRIVFQRQPWTPVFFFFTNYLIVWTLFIFYDPMQGKRA